MATIQFSVMQEVDRKLTNYAQQADLAVRTAFIDSTLYSVNPGYDDFDVHYGLKFTILSKTKAELIRLGILSWYLPRTHGTLLRLELFNLVKYNRDLLELDFILKSRGHCHAWLAEQIQDRGKFWVFGNFLNKTLWSSKALFNLYKVKRIRNYKTNKDRPPEKRYIGVGYKDKGSPRGDARGSNYNFSRTLLHNEITERRAQTDTLKGFLEGFLT